MWLFYPATALTVASYAYREFRTRGGTARPYDRLVVPGLLLPLFAVVVFQPVYLDRNKDGGYWNILEVLGNGGLVGVGAFAGPAAILVAAVPTPGSQVWVRVAGYAGAALTVVCLLVLDASEPPYCGREEPTEKATHLAMWLFYAAALLTIATFIHRDTRTPARDATPQAAPAADAATSR